MVPPGYVVSTSLRTASGALSPLDCSTATLVMLPAPSMAISTSLTVSHCAAAAMRGSMKPGPLGAVVAQPMDIGTSGRRASDRSERAGLVRMRGMIRLLHIEGVCENPGEVANQSGLHSQVRSQMMRRDAHLHAIGGGRPHRVT